jgi:hypothetical protein
MIKGLFHFYQTKHFKMPIKMGYTLWKAKKIVWFDIYWTRLNVSKALSNSNGNVCISLSTQNIDYKKWENQMEVIWKANIVEFLD